MYRLLKITSLDFPAIIVRRTAGISVCTFLARTKEFIFVRYKYTPHLIACAFYLPTRGSFVESLTFCCSKNTYRPGVVRTADDDKTATERVKK